MIISSFLLFLSLSQAGRPFKLGIHSDPALRPCALAFSFTATDLLPDNRAINYKVSSLNCEQADSLVRKLEVLLMRASETCYGFSYAFGQTYAELTSAILTLCDVDVFEAAFPAPPPSPGPINYGFANPQHERLARRAILMKNFVLAEYIITELVNTKEADIPVHVGMFLDVIEHRDVAVAQRSKALRMDTSAWKSGLEAAFFTRVADVADRKQRRKFRQAFLLGDLWDVVMTFSVGDPLRELALEYLFGLLTEWRTKEAFDRFRSWALDVLNREAPVDWTAARDFATDEMTAALSQLLLNFSPRATHERYWSHLVRILNTPRPSTDFDGVDRPERLDQIKQYIRTFSTSQAFEYREDAAGNVFVRSNAPLKPLVTFQGHLDIVTSKNAHVDHDWETEGVEARISEEADGVWLRSTKETTLGADNGVAIAAALAVMETHKSLPLEAVFTVNEETSFSGASNIDTDLIHANFVLNLDSEEDGKVCIGSAGGFERELVVSVNQVDLSPDDRRPLVRISLRGLPGGHSGIDINRGRPHAMKVLARIIAQVDFKTHNFNVVSVTGGSAKNVIPREAEILAVCNDVELLKAAILEAATDLPENAELEITEAVTTAGGVKPFTDTSEILGLIANAHHGVLDHLKDASVNFATVSTVGDSLVFGFFARSSYVESLASFGEELAGHLPGGTPSDILNSFAAWQPDPDSKFTQLVADASPKPNPELYAVHAGLECGVILERARGRLSAASIGPDIIGAHSPDERLSVQSSIRFIDWIDNIVAKLQAAAARDGTV